MHPIIRCSIMVMSIFMLSSCTAALMSTAKYGIFQKQDVNLADKNYAAADFLIQQADTFIGDNDLIRAKTMTDIQQPQMSATIGNLVPEQVATRLSRLGYRVDLSGVSTSNDAQLLKASIKEDEQASFILSGTYLRGQRDLTISLRIIEIKSRRIVAAFDYALPMNREIAELSDPEPKIFRVEE